MPLRLLTAVVLTILLAACGSGPTSGQPSPTPPDRPAGAAQPTDVPSLPPGAVTAEPPSPQPELGDEVQFRHILFSPDDDPMAALDLPPSDPAWKAAESDAAAEYQLVLRDPSTFIAEARTKTDDAGTAADGGLLEYVPREKLDPAIAAAVFRPGLAPDEILPPVRSSFGWHVIEFVGRRVSPEAVRRAANAAAAALAPGDRLMARVDSGLLLCAWGECHEQIDIYRSGALWTGPLDLADQGLQPSFKIEASLLARLASLIDTTDFEAILRRPVLPEGTPCPDSSPDGPVWDYEFAPAKGPGVFMVACRYGVDITTEEPFKTFWEAAGSYPP